MKIEIANQIPDNRNHLKVYLMWTKCRHSNKSESTKKLKFNEECDMKLLHQYVDFLTPLLDADMSDSVKLTEEATNRATTLGISDGIEVIRSVIPPDNKSLGMLATLTDLRLTYFNEHGHEFFVNIVHD